MEDVQFFFIMELFSYVNVNVNDVRINVNVNVNGNFHCIGLQLNFRP